MNGGSKQGPGEIGGEHAKASGGATTGGGQHPTSKDGNGRRAAFDLEERLLAYAVRVVRAVDLLPKSRGADHLGGQLLRSGTSPALNHGEAQAAESLNDFIHKMKICLKELRESRRTLLIIQGVPLTGAGKDAEAVFSLIGETEELIRIFYAAIRTATSRRDARATDANPASRLREDSLDFASSARASLNGDRPEEIDPITGAAPWMLDVGCWMLDVDRSASSSAPPQSPNDREGSNR